MPARSPAGTRDGDQAAREVRAAIYQQQDQRSTVAPESADLSAAFAGHEISNLSTYSARSPLDEMAELKIAAAPDGIQVSA